MIITKVTFQNSPEMPLVDHDHVVQTFSANTSDNSFRIALGKRHQLHRMVAMRHNAFKSRIHFTRCFAKSLTLQHRRDWGEDRVYFHATGIPLLRSQRVEV